MLRHVVGTFSRWNPGWAGEQFGDHTRARKKEENFRARDWEWDGWGLGVGGGRRREMVTIATSLRY